MGDIAKMASRAALPFQEWLSYFTFNGTSYPLTGISQTLSGQREDLDGTFASLATGAYRGNGIVFACMLVRALLFSEARFQYRELRSGRPGKLFGSADLAILEKPWTNGTTGDLLTRMIVDADLAGNAFIARRRARLRRLRPDWVSIILGSSDDDDVQAGDIDAEVLGYVYYPGGRRSGREPVILDRTEVAHFAPIPDPLASYRGMSWLTPILREVASDSAATSHKQRFFENGATPNMVVKLDKDIALQAFREWVENFKEHEPVGLEKAYRTLYLGAGADVTVVGGNLQQVDFKAVQGAGETRIAAAAGVPAPIVGISEGLAGSSLNAGNYGMARRRLADGTMRPLWRNAAGSLSTLVPVRAGAELWYDDRDIPFLAEDVKDQAEVQQMQSVSIKQLVDAGFKADSVIEAITSGDLSRLEHTGLFSVQLQPPMTEGSAGDPAAAAGRALASLIAPHLARKDHTDG